MCKGSYLVILVLSAGVLFGETPSATNHVVQKFSGSGTISTASFTVEDKWEIVWDSPTPLRITLLSSDGTIIAGVAGVFKGSLYQPKGGSYYLQVEGGNPGVGGNTSAMAPWSVSVVEIGIVPANPANGLASSYSVPSTVMPPKAPTPSSPPFPSPQSGSADTTPAATTSTNAPPATPAPIVKLTEDQARAVVLIKGDNAQGTGFLVKMADGPVVVTNLHVISNNPNIKILTSTGVEIPTLSLKGATDRDLVLFAIKDANYNYLDLATDVSQAVQTGDDVITPGNSEGGEVTVNTGGKVIGMGPQRIEFDNPVYHGNSGGPVFHTKSGKVVGVVTEVIKVDTSNELDKASFANRKSALSNSMRYFGLRLDTVSKWEPYDWRRLLNETTFLEQFHQQSRCLDSYLNGRQGTPKGDLYLTDDKIHTSQENFTQKITGADSSQYLDALRGLLFDLNAVADTNMSSIQELSNFYLYDQKRAAEEAEYRSSLKKELDDFGNDISRFGSVARKNN